MHLFRLTYKKVNVTCCGSISLLSFGLSGFSISINPLNVIRHLEYGKSRSIVKPLDEKLCWLLDFDVTR